MKNDSTRFGYASQMQEIDLVEKLDQLNRKMKRFMEDDEPFTSSPQIDRSPNPNLDNIKKKVDNWKKSPLKFNQLDKISEEDESGQTLNIQSVISNTNWADDKDLFLEKIKSGITDKALSNS